MLPIETRGRGHVNGDANGSADSVDGTEMSRDRAQSLKRCLGREVAGHGGIHIPVHKSRMDDLSFVSDDLPRDPRPIPLENDGRIRAGRPGRRWEIQTELLEPSREPFSHSLPYRGLSEIVVGLRPHSEATDAPGSSKSSAAVFDVMASFFRRFRREKPEPPEAESKPSDAYEETAIPLPEPAQESEPTVVEESALQGEEATPQSIDSGEASPLPERTVEPIAISAPAPGAFARCFLCSSPLEGSTCPTCKMTWVE